MIAVQSEQEQYPREGMPYLRFPDFLRSTSPISFRRGGVSHRLVCRIAGHPDVGSPGHSNHAIAVSKQTQRSAPYHRRGNCRHRVVATLLSFRRRSRLHSLAKPILSFSHCGDIHIPCGCRAGKAKSTPRQRSSNCWGSPIRLPEDRNDCVMDITAFPAAEQ